jgi:hypothetical protein
MDPELTKLLFDVISKLGQRFDECAVRLNICFVKWEQQFTSPSALTPFVSPISTAMTSPETTMMAFSNTVIVDPNCEGALEKHVNVGKVITTTTLGEHHTNSSVGLACGVSFDAGCISSRINHLHATLQHQ